MKIHHLVVLLMLCGITLTACATATPVPAIPALTSVPPTVAPTSVPATIAPPPTAMPSASSATIIEFPHLGGGDTAGDEQAPGKYKPPAWFSIPFSFETTKAYRGIAEQIKDSELFGLAQGRAILPPKMINFFAFQPTVTVEDAISELHATDKMQISPNQTVTVAGISGTQFDGTTDQDIRIPAIAKLTGHVGDDWQPNSSHAHIRFIVLPVAGRTLLIYIEAPVDEFDSFIGDANEVLGTVKFAQ